LTEKLYKQNYSILDENSELTKFLIITVSVKCVTISYTLNQILIYDYAN